MKKGNRATLFFDSVGCTTAPYRTVPPAKGNHQRGMSPPAFLSAGETEFADRPAGL